MSGIRSEITRILVSLNVEDFRDPKKTSALLEALYPELRRMAGGLMRKERVDHTLQPTALVHEAYMKLVDQTSTEWKDRAHFLGVASRAMRQILVDHARKHGAAKRGGGWQRVTMDEIMNREQENTFEILNLNDAMEKLSVEDERAARVVEYRVFGGMTVEEIAHVLGVSKRTVDSDWAVARMWLSRELKSAGSS